MATIDINIVNLLIHSDKPDGSVDFADSGPEARIITPVGSVQHSTNQAKFSGSSIYFNGPGNYLTTPFLTSAFAWWQGCTVGCWVYASSWSGWQNAAGAPCLFGNKSATEQTNYFSWGPVDTGALKLYYYNGNSVEVTTPGTIPINTWALIWLTVAAGIIYLFIDGKLEISAPISGVPQSSELYPLSIGQSNNAGITGYVQEILYADQPLSTVNFTPPTSPWVLGLTRIDYEQQQNITTLLGVQQTQLLSMASRLYKQTNQIIATARMLNLAHNQVFDTTTPLYLSQDQVFNNLAQVALLTTQVLRCYGAPVALEVLQTWAAYDYNLVYLPIVQIIGAQLDAVLQEIQFSVTVVASPVGVVDCDFDRKGFCNVATLLLRDRSEWINKQVGDPVVLTVLGEQYQLIVVNKPQDEQIAQGSYEVGYLLECASITCQLAEGLNPDIVASRVTAYFPSGTMLTEILDFLTDGVCSYNLAVPDFPVGEYVFEAVERFAALREVLPEQYGWIIQTDQVGVLQISQWSKPDIGVTGQKTLTMRRKSLTPPADKPYTQVEISNFNQQDGTSGLILEVVDNGDGTGTIHGYSVPWTDAFSVFDSEDSAAPSLLITGGAVEEVEVDDTDVEFVDYGASLSKPCYSNPVIDWGNNDSLSPVTYTESGALTTATEPGYSVAMKITFFSRRKKWTYDNRKIDVSQVRLKYHNENF